MFACLVFISLEILRFLCNRLLAVGSISTLTKITPLKSSVIHGGENYS